MAVLRMLEYRSTDSPNMGSPNQWAAAAGTGKGKDKDMEDYTD